MRAEICQGFKTESFSSQQATQRTPRCRLGVEGPCRGLGFLHPPQGLAGAGGAAGGSSVSVERQLLKEIKSPTLPIPHVQALGLCLATSQTRPRPPGREGLNQPGSGRSQSHPPKLCTQPGIWATTCESRAHSDARRGGGAHWRAGPLGQIAPCRNWPWHGRGLGEDSDQRLGFR